RLVDGPSSSGARMSATLRSLGGAARPERRATRSSGSTGRLSSSAAVSTVAAPTLASFVAALYAVIRPSWMVTSRNGWPNGDNASNRTEAGARARRTPFLVVTIRDGRIAAHNAATNEARVGAAAVQTAAERPG